MQTETGFILSPHEMHCRANSKYGIIITNKIFKAPSLQGSQKMGKIMKKALLAFALGIYSLYGAGKTIIVKPEASLRAVHLRKQLFDNQLRLWLADLKQRNALLPQELQAVMNPHIADIQTNIAAMQPFVDNLSESARAELTQDAQEVLNLLDRRQNDIEYLYYAPVKQAQEMALKDIEQKGSSNVDQTTLDTLFEQAGKQYETITSPPTGSSDQAIKETIATIETRGPIKNAPAPVIEVTEQEVVPVVMVSPTFEQEQGTPQSAPASAEGPEPTESAAPTEMTIPPKAPALTTTAAISSAIAKERPVNKLRPDEIARLTAPFTAQEIEALRAMASYEGTNAYQLRMRNAAKKLLRTHEIPLMH